MNIHSEDIQYTTGITVLGFILVATSDTGVCAVFLGDDKNAQVGELRQAFPGARLTENPDGLGEILKKVTAFVDVPGTGVAFALDIRGTDFQRRVWQALRAIPSGETRTYQQIATSLGDADAVRAVAGACAANVLAVVVPCHRVVRKDGTLSGFRWGIPRKRQLLQMEAQA